MKDPFLLAFSISAFGLLLLLVNTVLFFITKRFFENNKLYKALLMYLTIYFSIELTCNTLGFLKPNSNIFVSHFAFNLQYLILSMFFYKLFKERILKRIVIIILVLFLIANGIYFLNDLDLFWQFNLFEIAFISFMTIAYTLIHLYKNLGDAKNYFYFTIGVSTYMLTSCLIFLSGNIELVFFKEPYIDIWVFNSLFFIVYQYLIFKEWRYLNTYKRDVRE